MVFSSAAIFTVAEVCTDTWQWMRRVPSSEMLNTQQLLEVAFCFPFDHLVLCLCEFFCFFPLSDSDDDDDDNEDVLVFYHNSYDDYADHYHGSSSSSTLDFDDH